MKIHGSMILTLIRCFNCLPWKTSFLLNKQKTDKAGRILILDVTLDGDYCILINLYNANTETDQCKIFNEFQSLLFFF